MTTTTFSGETVSSPVPARLGALSLVLAGILFVLYPALRPFSNEASLQGAQAFASPFWILAHMLAIGGFILLALSLLGVSSVLRQTPVRRLMSVALVITWIGVGLTLPYYGAEIFALHAIGQEAVRQQSVALLPLVNAVRYGPAIFDFAAGLLGLSVGSILVAIAVGRSGILSRWSGSIFALAFALYIPQFFGNQPIRVAHGVLVALGCLWLAWSLGRSRL
ncbi:MAG TPA: hypothetical protein VF043_01680 [Ktedonobacteraceae bacterium]